MVLPAREYPPQGDERQWSDIGAIFLEITRVRAVLSLVWNLTKSNFLLRHTTREIRSETEVYFVRE